MRKQTKRWGEQTGDGKVDDEMKEVGKMGEAGNKSQEVDNNRGKWVRRWGSR